MRPAELICLAFFGYVTLIGLFFDRPNLHWQPLFILFGAYLAFQALSKLPRRLSALRDWLPILYTLIAFREMEVFVPTQYPLAFEQHWIQWDYLILHDWGWRAAIESFGKIGPLYLEFCYLLVYGLAAYGVSWAMTTRDRHRVNRFWVVYLTGTLGAYALFPFFPSLPPRYAFPLTEAPQITTWARSLNLWLLKGATIHAGVFPSAHVSSAFSTAWALYLIFPQRRWLGHSMVLYAISVSVATLYGRYHYAADVAAGFAVSLLAAAFAYGLARMNDVQKH